jgi:hypothetical protein
MAIRLGAVLMAVSLIEQWPRLFVTGPDGRLITAAIVLDALGLLLAFVLWIKPGLLAWWAAGRNGREVFESDINATQLQYIAFSVAGIYKLITGLAGMAAHGLNLVVYHQLANDGLSAAPPPYEKTMFVEYVVATAAGLALTLGARGLSGYLHRLRTFGSPKVAIDEVSES